MRALYTSDLHGDIDLYRELLTLAMTSSAEIIVLGGDLLPSLPPGNRYEEMIPNQKGFIDRFLSPLFRKILEMTRTMKIFLIAGNWDLGFPYLVKDPTEGIIDLNQRSFRLENGYELFGYPFVPPTPFRPKDYEKMDDPEAPWPPQKNPSYILSFGGSDHLTPIDPHLYLRKRETIREDLERLPEPASYRRAIYIMHSPPLETHLDCIQGQGSAGSRSIKLFIEKHQPLLTLHGHIHESPELCGHYLDRIGGTLSVNPGQSTQKGTEPPRLYAVTFEMENVEGTLRHTCFP